MAGCRLGDARERLLEALAEKPAVGEPREIVVMRGPAQGFLGELAVVDVLDRAVPADDAALLSAPGCGAGAEPAIGPVLHAQAVIDVEGRAGRDRPGPFAQGVGPIFGMQGLAPAGARRFAHAHPGAVLPARGHIEETALRIGRPGNLRVELDGVAMMLLAFAQSRIVPLPLDCQRR